ncbi:hypothetical protein chiPu_0023198, partial [Chiloscyllium punctatum]|nr:hypothetical protein [Chiloscyllium punctatum]
NLVSFGYVYMDQGAVVLEFSCFDEAERIYTQVKDTTVNDRHLTTVIIPVIE